MHKMMASFATSEGWKPKSQRFAPFLTVPSGVSTNTDGQVLDVDGDCGGFNLMFAFGSGILAGLDGRNVPWTHENAQKS